MKYCRNESTLKQMKKDELLQIICADILVLSIYIRLGTKKELILLVNGLDDLLGKVIS